MSDSSQGSTRSASATAVQDSEGSIGTRGSQGAQGQDAGRPAVNWSDTTTTLPAVPSDDDDVSGGSMDRSFDDAGVPSPPPAAARNTGVGKGLRNRPGKSASVAGASGAAVPGSGLAPPVVGSAPGAAVPPVAPVGAAGPVSPPTVVKVPKRADRAPRRAKLQIRHLNIWSVLKFSCVLALALFLVWLIVIAVLYGTLDKMHVFAKIDETVQKINGDKVEQDYVSRNVVFGAALIIGLVNTVLFIVLSTIGAIVYNLCADLVGGVEVTLAEREH